MGHTNLVLFSSDFSSNSLDDLLSYWFQLLRIQLMLMDIL